MCLSKVYLYLGTKIQRQKGIRSFKGHFVKSSRQTYWKKIKPL